ncbi:MULTISPECIES: hypothetical protein [unclassified Mycobacterium]|uniref:hypothetical protein n=1 Tax=unclassified Mycobacterium TaxID=2642494 RepID=UPI0029C8D93E|nr:MULTISPECIES: hypothetical protein [unclassified Mycobacterium]
MSSGRVPFADCPKGWFHVAYSRDVTNGKQIEQDIPIWEAKIYRDKPALARGEFAITEFKIWAERSYAESR